MNRNIANLAGISRTSPEYRESPLDALLLTYLAAIYDDSASVSASGIVGLASC